MRRDVPVAPLRLQHRGRGQGAQNFPFRFDQKVCALHRRTCAHRGLCGWVPMFRFGLGIIYVVIHVHARGKDYTTISSIMYYQFLITNKNVSNLMISEIIRFETLLFITCYIRLAPLVVPCCYRTCNQSPLFLH